MNQFRKKGFFNKLEKKFGKYAIHNLTMFLIAGYAVGYFLNLISPQLETYLTLNPCAILHGQIWRLFTWVITAPSSLDIFTIIMLTFYFSIGQSLENVWGAFYYNLYVIGGIIFTILGSFAAYIAMSVLHIGVPEAYIGVDGVNQVIGHFIGAQISTYYLCMSLLLAFAATFPDHEILFWFIIPIKVKWLGVFYAATILVSFLQGSVVTNIIVIASLMNFIVFFISSRKSISPKQYKKKRQFRQQTHIRMQNGDGSIHKCYICGRTEKTNPELTFRYCSKCKGNYEYCQDHLFTHQHIQ